LGAEGIDVVAASPEHFAEVLRRDHAKFARIVREIGYPAR
jgi:hypothetical protein